MSLSVPLTFFFQRCVPSGEATHTNIKAFGLTRPGLESTIYRIRGELAINYATNPVTSSINMNGSYTLPKGFNIGMCCFSARHASLRRKSKDWLARNQNNVSKWSDMSIRGMLLQWVSTIQFQLRVLIYNKADLIIISLIINLLLKPLV
jgi:hypothetical protein